MALIECPDCRRPVSDRADSCPACGVPIARRIDKLRAGAQPRKLAALLVDDSSAHGQPDESKVARGFPLGLVIGAVFLIAGGVTVILLLSGGSSESSKGTASGAYEAVREMIPAPVAPVVVPPWEERAAALVRKEFTGETGESIASLVQRVTHPTGESPALDQVAVRTIGETVAVRISVLWRGGFLGGRYNTIVEWTFDASGDRGVEIISDTAPTRVAKRNIKMLRETFAGKLYKAVADSVPR